MDNLDFHKSRPQKMSSQNFNNQYQKDLSKDVRIRTKNKKHFQRFNQSENNSFRNTQGEDERNNRAFSSSSTKYIRETSSRLKSHTTSFPLLKSPQKPKNTSKGTQKLESSNPFNKKNLEAVK